MKKCEFGCGQKALHQFPSSGKWCCAKSCSSCPGMRRKNGEANRLTPKASGSRHGRPMLGRRPWNFGKSLETDTRIAKAAKKLKRTIAKEPSRHGWNKDSRHTAETKLKISKAMKAAGAGGYRRGSGRGKKGWYKGIFCDSSWELAFVLWCELKGRKVKRAKKKFEYRYKGKTRKYLPDFRYQNGEGQWKYVEVKGYVSEQWKAKKKAFPHELLLLEQSGMTRSILPVVHKHYGKNFVDLYE